MQNLAAKAWLSLVALAVVMGALLFGLAGTMRYWQGWIYISIFMGASVLTTLDLVRRDPALLERRLRGGPTAERRPAQRIIMAFTSIGFTALLVVPALDHRFGWSHVPTGVVIAGDALVALGFLFIAIVYRVNTFTAATIQVAKDQTVISTGPYAIVRHPMYASALLYLGGTPPALGSWRGFIAIAAMVPFLVWRLVDEERMLAAELRGYPEYMQRVRHRLVPFVW